MNRGPRDVIRAYLALRERLSSAPSVQGVLEDLLRQGGRVSSSMDIDRLQRRWDSLAEAVRATCALTPDELAACRLRYQPDARDTSPETYERVVQNCDVPAETTGAGEDVLGQAYDPAGQPIPGHSRVQGQRARMPSYREVGRRLGCSAWQARQLLGSALDKVRQHLTNTLRDFDRLDEL